VARQAPRHGPEGQAILGAGPGDDVLNHPCSDPAIELADWTRIYKRVDVEHPKPGRNSFQAIVGRQVVGRDHVIHTAVYSVAYTKDHGVIEVISIRFADTSERAVFFR
jgi:uncharacterized DUF497 family protein